MRLRFLTLFVFFTTFLNAQQTPPEPEFGNPTQEELDMTIYEKDPDADAVVLYERGDYEFAMVDNNLMLIKKVYRKIKILTDEAKDFANVSVYTFRTNDEREWLSEIKAVTTSDFKTIFVANEDFHPTQNNGNTEWRFTFPNVQKGSIIEYEYVIVSPFFFNLEGWVFQNNIPTIYSAFHATIPGYFQYNRNLRGNRPLNVNSATIKKGCFYPLQNSNAHADCEVIDYAMYHIPAFKEEKYMLSKNNYLSRIEFQLKEMTFIDGRKKYYTKSWDVVDKEYRKNKSIGKQSRKNAYFDRKLPDSILSLKNKKERAKAVYSYIQNRYIWNGSYSFFNDINVKDAFKSREGTISEINLSLINALNAADIDAEIALLSTRQNGIPTKNYAVMSEFNYLVAHLNLDGQSVFLDATDKNVPFGTLPFRCLNYEARVMDFKKGSYWEPIVPEKNNMTYINAQIKIEDDGTMTGKLRETNTGYNAIERRKELDKSGREDYLRAKETAYTSLEITQYDLVDKNNIDKPITENYEIAIQAEAPNLLVFNPFIFKGFMQNPFQLEERSYPVDFGHPSRFTYLLSLDLSGQYTLSELPENKAIKFPEDAGEASVVYSLNGNVFQMRFHFELNETHFEPNNYQALKSFFDMVVKVQNNTPLVLKKVE